MIYEKSYNTDNILMFSFIAELYFADEQDCSIVGGVELRRRRSADLPGSYPHPSQQPTAPRCRIRGKKYVSLVFSIGIN